MARNAGEEVSGADYAAPADLIDRMSEFDRLPWVVRDAINHAPFQVSAFWAASLLRRGASPYELAISIRRQCDELVDNAYRDRGFYDA